LRGRPKAILRRKPCEETLLVYLDLVEAVGIEPTSEKHNPTASTCVALSGKFAGAPQERTSARDG